MTDDPQTGPEDDDAGAGGGEHGSRSVATAATRSGSPDSRANALAFFMGEVPPPGFDDRFPLYLDMGGPDKVEYWFRSLELEEIDKANIEGAKARDAGAGNLGATFVAASYMFAFACVEPDLAAALEHRRKNDPDPDVRARMTDTAALVREVFRKRAGVLEQAAARIDDKSKLGDASSVNTQIEAGKGSR